MIARNTSKFVILFVVFSKTGVYIELIVEIGKTRNFLSYDKVMKIN